VFFIVVFELSLYFSYVFYITLLDGFAQLFDIGRVYSKTIILQLLYDWGVGFDRANPTKKVGEIYKR